MTYTNRSIDRMVARYVMKWKVGPGGTLFNQDESDTGFSLMPSEGEKNMPPLGRTAFTPSESWSMSGLVQLRMLLNGYAIAMRVGQQYAMVRFEKGDSHGAELVNCPDKMPLAVSLASLKAINAPHIELEVSGR